LYGVLALFFLVKSIERFHCIGATNDDTDTFTGCETGLACIFVCTGLGTGTLATCDAGCTGLGTGVDIGVVDVFDCCVSFIIIINCKI